MYCKKDAVIGIHLAQNEHMDFTFSKCNQIEFRTTMRKTDVTKYANSHKRFDRI